MIRPRNLRLGFTLSFVGMLGFPGAAAAECVSASCINSWTLLMATLALAVICLIGLVVQAMRHKWTSAGIYAAIFLICLLVLVFV